MRMAVYDGSSHSSTGQKSPYLTIAQHIKNQTVDNDVAPPEVKPEDVTVPQWISANALILIELMSYFDNATIVAYLRYTAKIGEYLQVTDVSSVMKLDELHRKAVAFDGRNWDDISDEDYLFYITKVREEQSELQYETTENNKGSIGRSEVDQDLDNIEDDNENTEDYVEEFKIARNTVKDIVEEKSHEEIIKDFFKHNISQDSLKKFVTSGKLMELKDIISQLEEADNIDNEKEKISTAIQSTDGNKSDDSDIIPARKFVLKKRFKRTAKRKNLRPLRSTALQKIDAIQQDIKSEPYDDESNLHDESTESHQEDVSVTKSENAEDQSQVYTCNICGKLFPSAFKYKKHLKYHKNTSKKKKSKLKCDRCARTFISEVTLEKHKESHDQSRKKESSELQRFQCKTCEKEFSSKYTLNSHMKIHKQGMTFKCHFCNKMFVDRTNLNKHVKCVHAEKPFQCEQCKKRFIYESALKRHAMCHTDSKAYTCHYCGEQYNTNHGMKFHIASKHEHTKNYICSVCNKGFILLGDLKKHSMTHTGEKPHVCHICGKGFIEIGNLNRHMLNHTGDMPHQCKICSEKFRWGVSLKNHMKRHHPEFHEQNSKSLSKQSPSKESVPPQNSQAKSQPTLPSSSKEPVFPSYQVEESSVPGPISSFNASKFGQAPNKNAFELQFMDRQHFDPHFPPQNAFNSLAYAHQISTDPSRSKQFENMLSQNPAFEQVMKQHPIKDTIGTPPEIQSRNHTPVPSENRDAQAPLPSVPQDYDPHASQHFMYSYLYPNTRFPPNVHGPLPSNHPGNFSQ